MTLDVLIVNYLTGDLVHDAVRHVQGPGVRVLVHDNSGEVLADPPTGAEVMGTGENIYFAAANNALQSHCRAPLLLLLNPDVTLEHSALLRLVARLEDEPAAWGVIPRLVSPQGNDVPYVRRLPTFPALVADRVPLLRPLLRRSYRQYYCLDDECSLLIAEQPAAACLLLRAHRAPVPLFDERYRLFFNDTDLARRLNASGGHCVIARDVTAVHVGGASISRARAASAAWIRAEYDRSLLRYALRHVRGGIALAPVIGLRLLLHRLLR